MIWQCILGENQIDSKVEVSACLASSLYHQSECLLHTCTSTNKNSCYIHVLSPIRRPVTYMYIHQSECMLHTCISTNQNACYIDILSAIRMPVTWMYLMQHQWAMTRSVQCLTDSALIQFIKTVTETDQLNQVPLANLANDSNKKTMNVAKKGHLRREGNVTDG